MDETIKAVAMHFEYNDAKIEVIQQKLSYLLKTKDEEFLIRKNFTSNEDIIKQLHIQEAVVSTGYKNLSCYVLDNENLPYCNVEDETYNILKNISKQVISLEQKEEVLKAVRELAKFHNKTKNMNISEEIKQVKTFNTEDIIKDINEINKIKKKIHKAKKKTEFDIYVLKNCNKYLERANEVKNILEETNYNNLESDNINNNSLCLNLVKEEQFALKGDDVIINSVVEISIGYQLNDLVRFIHRYLQKNIINENTDILSVTDIINEYSKINNIDDINFKIIQAKIMYPFDFFKLVKKHYKKHRGWTLGIISSRIKQLEETDNIYIKYCTK